VHDWYAENIFRTNYFFLSEQDTLDYACTDWFICQHDPSDFRACVAFMRGIETHGGAGRSIVDAPCFRFWIPGIDAHYSSAEVSKRLDGADVRVQRHFPRLPPACRWEQDLAPERPLMGSFALAVAVGMQPDELYVCGHDLFQHPSKRNQGGMDHDTRPWQQDFVSEYVSNRHRNHTLRGDLKYIRAALDAYEGHLVCCGTVLKEYFARDYAAREWEWIDG